LYQFFQCIQNPEDLRSGHETVAAFLLDRRRQSVVALTKAPWGKKRVGTMVLRLARTPMDDVCRKSVIETTLDSPRQRSARRGAAEFDPTDVVVVEAWARIVPGVESFHHGQFEDGGACIWLLVRDADAPATLTTWLIWPEAGQILVRTTAPKSGQSRHRTLRSALQAVTPVSPVQWCRVSFLAETMLSSRSTSGVTRSPQDAPKAAA
jgi:hypothetical protein